MPTLYWCPHQVLKATGAPALFFIYIILVFNYLPNLHTRNISYYIFWLQAFLLTPRNINFIFGLTL
jgi:hypothetical protein